jgi:hypothetical protein
VEDGAATVASVVIRNATRSQIDMGSVSASMAVAVAKVMVVAVEVSVVVVAAAITAVLLKRSRKHSLSSL